MAEVGRRSDLEDDKLYQCLLENIPKVIIQTHVAWGAGIHPNRLSEWLNKGIRNLNEGVDSIYAQFACDYHATRMKVIEEKLHNIQTDKENSAGIRWVLERCFREDFGKESEELRQMRELFYQLFPSMQGARHGKENTESPGTEPMPTARTE